MARSSQSISSEYESVSSNGPILSTSDLFTSQQGSALAAHCTHCLMAEHTSSDRVQEIHELAYHLVCDRVERHFAGGAGCSNKQLPAKARA